MRQKVACRGPALEPQAPVARVLCFGPEPATAHQARAAQPGAHSAACARRAGPGLVGRFHGR